MFMFRPDPPAVLTQVSPSPLLIHGGFNLAFDCLDYTPMVLAIRVRPEREQDLVEPETLTLFPEVSHTTFIDNFGNRCTCLIAPPGRLSIWNRFVMADSGLPEELPTAAYQHQVGNCPKILSATCSVVAIAIPTSWLIWLGACSGDIGVGGRW